MKRIVLILFFVVLLLVVVFDFHSENCGITTENKNLPEVKLILEEKEVFLKNKEIANLLIDDCCTYRCILYIFPRFINIL